MALLGQNFIKFWGVNNLNKGGEFSKTRNLPPPYKIRHMRVHKLKHYP